MDNISNTEITCIFGIKYKVYLPGEREAVERKKEMLSRCCCFMCQNHNCPNDREEIFRGNSALCAAKYCKSKTRTPYCSKPKSRRT